MPRSNIARSSLRISADFLSLATCGVWNVPCSNRRYQIAKPSDVPVEDLQLVAAAIDKQKEVARQRILFEHSRNNALQAVEALAHVGGPGGKEDARARRDAQHDAAPSRWRRPITSSRQATVSGLVSRSNRSVKPPGVVISSGSFA